MSTAIQKREEFLEERRTYVGASDIAAVLGVDPYRTPLDVYNEKLGLVQSFEGNAHTERGLKLEAVAAQEYTERTGHKVHRRGTQLIHPRHSFIQGHLDRRRVGEGRPVEFKCPSRGAFHKAKRDGLQDGYIVQMQVYLWLDRRDVGDFALFCADLWDLVSFEVQADPDLHAQIEFAAVKFWKEHVEKEIPPAAIEADKPKLEFAKVGGEVAHIDDPEFIEAAQLLQEAKQLELDGKELYEIAKQRIIKMVGGFGKFQGGGLRLSYYESAGHSSFDKKRLAAEHPKINLSNYESRGAPFPVFKPYFINPKD